MASILYSCDLLLMIESKESAQINMTTDYGENMLLLLNGESNYIILFFEVLGYCNCDILIIDDIYIFSFVLA